MLKNLNDNNPVPAAPEGSTCKVDVADVAVSTAAGEQPAAPTGVQDATSQAGSGSSPPASPGTSQQTPAHQAQGHILAL